MSSANKQQKKKGRITRLWRYLWGSTNATPTADISDQVQPNVLLPEDGKVTVNDASMLSLIDSLPNDAKKNESLITQSTIVRVEEEIASIRSPHVDDDFISYLNQVVGQLEQHNLHSPIKNEDQFFDEKDENISESKVGFGWTDINVDDYLFNGPAPTQQENYYPLEQIVVGEDEIISHSNSDKRRMVDTCDEVVENDLKRHKLSTSFLQTDQSKTEDEAPKKNIDMSAEFSENTCDLLEKMERGDLKQDEGSLFKHIRMVPREEKKRRLEFEESIRRALDRVCGEDDSFDSDELEEDSDSEGVVNVLCREFEDIVHSVSGFFKNNCPSPISFQKLDEAKKTQ